MRILFLSHRIPFPPDKGDKIRTFNVLRHLAQQHEVWCAAFVDDPTDWRHVAALQGYCARTLLIPLNKHRAAVRGLMGLAIDESLTTEYYRSKAMRDGLRAWADETRFDAVWAFSSSMAPYAEVVPAARRVLDMCDRDSLKWAEIARRSRVPMSWIWKLEAKRLGAFEERCLRCFHATVLIGRHEADGFAPRLQRRLHFIGNGVQVPQLDQEPTYDSGVVGFVGDMRYWPNIDGVSWFAREIWPDIRAAVPNARFRIIGRNPTAAVRRLARVPGVKVTGAVDDVNAALSDCQVVAVPLRVARGVQNKVLEAMAAGRPVVATPQAATGIDAVIERDLLTGDAADMKQSIIYLLRNSEACRKLGLAGREQVIHAHNWDVLLTKAEQLCHPQQRQVARSMDYRPWGLEVAPV